MLSVRLDEATERRLKDVCRRFGLTKSEAVKRSLEQWLAAFEPAPDAYELGADLFDQGEAAEPPIDTLHRKIWDQLNAKYRPG
jgi:hypothetical protein